MTDSKGDAAPAGARPAISVVLPAYNEEPNVAQAVAQAAAAMQSIGADYEIVVVDDGSRDNTAAVVEGLVAGTPGLRLVRHPVNQGYGGALRTGFAAAQKEWILLNASDNGAAPCLTLLTAVPRFSMVFWISSLNFLSWTSMGRVPVPLFRESAKLRALSMVCSA